MNHISQYISRVFKLKIPRHYDIFRNYTYFMYTIMIYDHNFYDHITTIKQANMQSLRVPILRCLYYGFVLRLASIDANFVILELRSFAEIFRIVCMSNAERRFADFSIRCRSISKIKWNAAAVVNSWNSIRFQNISQTNAGDRAAAANANDSPRRDSL